MDHSGRPKQEPTLSFRIEIKAFPIVFPYQNADCRFVEFHSKSLLFVFSFLRLYTQLYYISELCDFVVKIGHLDSILLRRKSANRFEIVDKMRQIVEPCLTGSALQRITRILHEPDCLVDTNQAGECFRVHTEIGLEHTAQVPFAVINGSGKLFTGDVSGAFPQ